MPDNNYFSLEQVQQWMQDALVYPGKTADSIFDKVAVDEMINASAKLPAQRHLNIYRQSYIARLRECMKNQFSGLAYALGEELFQAFADDYLRAYPSESYTLNDLGKKFPDFLEATRPDANEEVKESWPDFMIELARFELELSVLFDERAQEKERFLSPGTTDEALLLTPVFHLFHHRFPVCRYYLDYTAKKNPELPFAGETYCAVTRKNFRLGLFEIKPAQFIFLSCMKKGKTVGEALMQTAEIFHLDEKSMNELWLEWRGNFIASGFFTT
jgi:hypothetical protein